MKRVVILPIFNEGTFLPYFIQNMVEVVKPTHIIINEGMFPLGPENKTAFDDAYYEKYTTDKCRSFDLEYIKEVVDEAQKLFPRIKIRLNFMEYEAGLSTAEAFYKAYTCGLPALEPDDVVFPLEADAFIPERSKEKLEQHIRNLGYGEGLKCDYIRFFESPYVRMLGHRPRRICFKWGDGKLYHKIYKEEFYADRYQKYLKDITADIYMYHYEWMREDPYFEERLGRFKGARKPDVIKKLRKTRNFIKTTGRIPEDPADKLEYWRVEEGPSDHPSALRNHPLFDYYFGGGIAQMSKEIIFVKNLCQWRILKIGMALKKQFPEWKLVLYYKSLLINKNLFEQTFELRKIDDETFVESVRKDNPYLFHVFCDVGNKLPYAVMTNTSRPVIYDANDLAGLYGGVENMNPTDRVEERFCLENADGIVTKFPKWTFDYYKDKGYQIKAPILEYLDYCIPDFFQNRESAYDLETIHMVYPGVMVSRDKEVEGHGNNIMTLAAEEMDKNPKLKFHLFPSPWLGAPKDYKEEKHPSLVIHHGLPQPDLQKELAKFHFGGQFNCFARVTTKDPMFGKTSIGSKTSTLMEAGLPILISKEMEWNTHVVERMGVGVGIAWDDIQNISDIVTPELYRILKSRVLVARENEYNAYKRVYDLIYFYDQIARRNVIKEVEKSVPSPHFTEKDMNLVREIESFVTRPIKYSVIIVTCNNYDNFVHAWNENMSKYVSDISNEIIIINNGSEDKTKDFIHHLPRQAMLINLPQNIGNAYAFTVGYRIARGDFIFSLDDDILLPNGWVEDGIRILGAIPELGFLGWRWGLKSGHQNKETINNVEVIRTSGMAFGTKCFRKDLLKTIGYYDLRFTPYGLGDSDLGIRAIKAGRFNAYVPDKFSRHMGGDQVGARRPFKDAALAKNQPIFRSKWRLEMMELEWDATPVIYTNPWEV